MTWFKVDDTLAWHQKVVIAGNGAMGLWVRSGSWASQQLTDGFVPADIAKALGSPAEIKKLVAAGLWHPTEHDGTPGYQFHQFLERNPSRADVEAERAANRKRQQRGREAARARREGRDPTVTPAVTP